MNIQIIHKKGCPHDEISLFYDVSINRLDMFKRYKFSEIAVANAA